MACTADFDIVHLGGFVARNVVRIVAGQAGHLRLPEAGGLPETIGRSGNLKSIESWARLLVEMQREVP